MNRVGPDGASLVASEQDLQAAYRLLLDREADPTGLRHYLQWVAEVRPSATMRADSFMAPAEHRARGIREDSLVRIDLGGYSVFARSGIIGANVLAHGTHEPYVMRWFSYSITPGSHPFAASDRMGLIGASCAADTSNGIVGTAAVEQSQWIVPTQRLDDVLSNPPRLDLVKINIEGHEPAAWSGMQEVLTRHRPVAFTEFSPIAICNVGHDEQRYLAQVFDYASSLRVLHRDVAPVECSDVGGMMSEWMAANRRAKLDDEMHLDRLIEGRAREG